MVNYTFAALAILSTAKLGAAVAPPSAFIAQLVRSNKQISSPNFNSRQYSAIPYDQFAENDDQGLPSFPSATSLLEIPVENQNKVDALVDALLAKKQERRTARLQRTRQPNYQITLPISGGLLAQPARLTNNEANGETLASLVAKGQAIALANTIGMSLRQVYGGRKLSELALDVDTLRFQSFVDELQGRRVDGREGDDAEVTVDMDATKYDPLLSLGSVQVLQNSALQMLKESFDGVVVSSVAQGGLAWNAGVRAGDVLTATSATLGNKLWPKSTLDGVRSAISSRKVLSPTMDFKFRRVALEEVDGVEAVQSFELSLSRPIGINVEDADDGYVTITGISNKAASVVKDNLCVGDRVVSVESLLGSQMWDVSSADGLTSAVISRLPGQPVRILFERVGELEEVTTANEQPPEAATMSFSDAVGGFRQAGKSVFASESSASTATPTQAQSAVTQSASDKMLLSRSRDLLRTYITRNEVTKNVKVADRVLEAVMDASAVLDGKTLNLIMKAYNTCNNAEKAIQTFEEVFGLAGDGSEKEVEQIHGGKLSADISALNIFSITALLRAHAIRGDYESALRVLAAVEGDAEFSIKGKKSRTWSGKGDPLNMLPDTRCYNVALAAAAKRGTKEGLRAAMEIFDSMPNPSLSNPPLGKPAKNLVTFNTMIDAFANAGQYQNADGVFQSLKDSSLRPDIVSYTTLIKASIKSGNLDKAFDILDDMKWIGIQPDIVSYNNIIESLCNANKLFEAKDLVNEMEMTSVSPDSMTYGLLMKGLMRANKPGPCLTLFESACADSRTTELTENVQLYTTAISAAAALGDHERALDLVSRMNRAGVKPNKKTLTALMGACIAGRKYSAAADIFSKIKNPDSYSISVGLKAMCLAEKFDAALELITDERSGQKTLNGKQVMSGYNILIQEALYSGEFDVAREAMSGLLRAGYIPSKLTFRAMIEGMSLQTDMAYSSEAMRKRTDPQPSDGKFEFLLFVLDSLEGRKLTVDSAFYTSILILGAQTGGLQKRISSLLTQSRKSGNQMEITLSEPESSEDESSRHITSWEDLLENYASYKEEAASSDIFPTIRVSSKDLGRVLAAEQTVAYRGQTIRVGSRR
mmetsp:Transcript_22966/g.49697  ORF Transcript_22966/g.49697 Transcript_22966/m.49697 type:complete len:1104 (+) Transcript_22966:265-3576(+)|eukprot:CAMPEP_0172311350 /NCGR_PEP_ID=MMETSP1058-20130122/14620_1 /TAXON_ID=83371 /ORGANISM="Detonula confervacea, Strain CCMP 353" /LENGTH=1103 /DNA_ID=CAMNT_0013024507 /DNA_START=217 /DNA_END=3528 /DNA_ORIENTATION=+